MTFVVQHGEEDVDRSVPGALDTETLAAIAELLQEANQSGLGVAFEPDGDGWRVSYILGGWPAYEDYELPGGQLANAYSLEIAAKAALKPMVEMGERAAAYFGAKDAGGPSSGATS